MLDSVVKLVSNVASLLVVGAGKSVSQGRARTEQKQPCDAAPPCGASSGKPCDTRPAADRPTPVAIDEIQAA